MIKLKERGVVNILALLVILAGIAGGVFIGKSKLNLALPQINQSASTNLLVYRGAIIFKNSDGSDLKTERNLPISESPSIKIEFYSPFEFPKEATPNNHLGNESTYVATQTATEHKKAPVIYNRPLPATNSNKVYPNPKKEASEETKPSSMKVVAFKFSENQEDLDNQQYQPYNKTPEIVDYTFKDKKMGLKYIWVQYLGSNGNVERRTAQIYIGKLENSTPPKTPQPKDDNFHKNIKIAADNFNRKDNPFEIGQAITGQNWVSLRGTFGVTDGQAYPTSYCPAPGYAAIEGNGSDGLVRVILSQNTQDARVLFRAVDLNNNYILERDGWGYHLEKTVKGERIELTPRVHNATFKNGDVVKIALREDDIKVYINNSLLLSIKDATFSGTKYGIGTWCANSMRFDNFAFIKLEKDSDIDLDTLEQSATDSTK